MNVNVSQPLATELDENRSISKLNYFEDFRRSFSWIHLKYKRFDDENWKNVFCSSSFHWINRYPNVFLIYRTFLLLVVMIDLIFGLVITDPIWEWPIYFTHLTSFVTFFAVLFQFLITSRVKFYRAHDLVPRSLLQYLHLLFIVLALSAGLAVSLIFWTIIYQRNPLPWAYFLRILLDHGVVWFLFFIDIFFLTRLEIVLIDGIFLMIFNLIYSLFTVIIYFTQWKFSRDRVGFVYRAMDFNVSPLRVTMQIIGFVCVAPLLVFFFLWNCFRLRQAIPMKRFSPRSSNSEI